MYNKQCNLCGSLIERENKNFNNISTRGITDKLSSKTVKLLFTGKVQTESKITVIEKKLFW